MPSGPAKSTRVAIVGASSLRGKELKLVLEDRNFPASDIVLLDEPALAGTLTEAGGEPTFIRALSEDSFEDARFVFFAGSQQDAVRNWPAAQSSGATVIDLSGALAASGESTSWIPLLDTVLLPRPGLNAAKSTTNGGAQRTKIRRLLFTRLRRDHRVHSGRGAVEIFTAARRAVALSSGFRTRSGRRGRTRSQTTNLLSFRPIVQPIFDAQVAFNLLAGYGPESKPTFAEVRNSIAKDVAQYLAGRAQAPAIQLVQAPVFYGYAFTAYAEFAAPQPSEQLQTAFSNLGVKVDAPEDPAPTNVTVAGESEIHLARIEPDPNVAAGVWIWGVADNLRLAVVNAVRIAEELVAEPPVQ